MREPFRFVHTADLHLDSPLRALTGRDEELGRVVAGATRRALDRIVELCLEERVDALLVAGDLYDGGNASVHTVVALTRALNRLGSAGIPVYLVLGNHDAASPLTRALELPANVHLFDGKGGRGGAVRTPCGRAVVHGVSYRQRGTPGSLLPKYGAPHPDVWNLALLHTSLAGGDGHDPYAPCSLDELVAKGYDYWALGHIHKRAVHRERDPAVVMPGIPQGRHVNEAGAKSVTLVELDESGPALHEHAVDSVRFERIVVDVDGLDAWPALLERAERALDDVVEPDGGSAAAGTVLRVELRGRTGLSWRLARDADELLETLRQGAAGRDGLWVESVSDRTRAADGAGATSAAAGGPLLAQLEPLLDDDLLSLPDTVARARASHKALVAKLPKELKRMFGADDEALGATLDELMRAGKDDALSKLRGTPTGDPDR